MLLELESDGPVSKTTRIVSEISNTAAVERLNFDMGEIFLSEAEVEHCWKLIRVAQGEESIPDQCKGI